ncbi:alpha-2-macroglobulin-like protein 1 isoform X3 [Haliotis rufescens]|uniref:alpha-2-macroglobulin-like protein 1 isoform X3 n=1 Tax=Haliotis rufescens TaxID=6454 RepID=UPI00201F0259|nr:alpha-2-macroglobulin-like protein 1 isoform X3 [Haliotis rufescens]
MRDGEEEEGEQMKHDNKTREGNYTFEEGGGKHVHGADNQGNYTANDTSSQHERDDTHVESDDGAAAHEEAGGDVVHDEGVGGDVHEEGGGTLHEEAGGGTLHENAGGGSVHDEDAGGKVHDEGGGDAVHDKGGGGALGNYTLEESDPVHEANNTHEVHSRREDGNNTHEVHSRREDGNSTHGEDEITLTDTNDTSEHTSDAREKMLPYNEGNRTQEEGNYTLESGKQTHEEGDHTRDDDVTRSDRLTNDGKVTVQPVRGALNKAVDKQANVSQGLGGEIQNDQSEGNENDTDVQDIDKSGTDNLTTHSDPSDHALSDVRTVGVGGNGSRGGDGGDMGNTLSEMGNETSKEGQMNSKDNCSNGDADDLGNDDYGYDEYDEYDDDDDDDYDEYDEYDEDDRGRNQISEDIYGEEPIQAAIFRPFGLRRKRASGIAAEMAGNDLSDEMEGGEGGEEPPAGPTGPPPPPPPSRHVSHFTLRVPVTEEMSPEASLLIYYVRDDGETVADSINFDVEACFKNKVKFDFLEKKVIPGREATLRLQAEPGSLCSIGMIDKSINILGGDHQLTPEKMFDILKKYGNGGEQYHYYKRDKEYCERKVNDEERTPEHEMYGEWWHYSSRYVDAVEAFRQMGMAVATNMLLETRPCSKEYAVLYEEGGLPGPGGGQRVLPLGIPLSAAQKKKPSGSVLRSYFPETWLWELEQVGDTGELELRKTTPHTITRWVGNTICTSQSAGVGVAPMTSLTTFQPFFLSIHLPYAAVRGERLPLHVTIFNYLEKCLYMQVNVETGDDITLTVRDHLKLPFCLCGGKSKTQSYYISAKEVGKLPIVARAEIVPGTCDNNIEPDTEYIGLSDAVKRELFVKVEGVTQEYTKSLYICPKDSDVTREEVELPLPDDIVRDSARGHVSVIGDIMGPALSNLDNLVQLPTGCGEQTMISFSPNIYVLKYLTFTSQLTDEMKLLCERYMEIGYTRELNYRHDDGSFSAFGKSDASGSTWLTAFVVKSFAQAQRFIYIDQTNLATSVSFLKSTRMENGCFREVGKVFSSYMMGGLGKVDGEDDTALTAFVVVALLEARVPRDDPVLMAALRCLSLQPRDEMDTYTLTLTAYAQTLNDPTSQASDAVMTELDARVISNGELGYWGRGGSMPDAVNTWHYRTAPSAEIEMTSYGLMATLLYYQDGGLAKGQPMIMWLSQQRNSLGGFASTQDTVLGLQAMAEFASKTFTGNATDLSVTFTGNKMSQTYDITTGVNTLLLQRAPIMHLPNTLSVSTNGTGCALIQANVQFNKLPENLGINKPLFNLTVAVRRSRTKRSDCARRSIRICVSFMGKKDFSAGMSMLTVKMVTAWTPVLNSLKELESVFPILSMKKYENDVKKGLIAFYFDELDVRKRCFEFELEQDRDVAVSDPKPAEIQAYQYYEKDVTIVKSYEINTTCGTKAEIPDETTAPPLLPGSPIEIQNRIGSVNDMPPLPSQKMQETTGCPACINEKPEDFDQLICQSRAIYKVQAGRNGRASMKIKADLRTRRKKKIDKFASFTLGSECQCDLLNPPNEKKRVRRLLILSNREQSLVQSVDPGSVGHVIHLGSSTIIINLDRNRKLEKETRKKARSCNRRS